MEINGVKYVKADTIEKMRIEIDDLKKENKKLITALQKLMPIEEDEIKYFLSQQGLSYINRKIRRSGSFGNERAEYEEKIRSLTNELAGAKSNLSKMKKQYMGSGTGEITLKKTSEAKPLTSFSV